MLSKDCIYFGDFVLLLDFDQVNSKILLLCFAIPWFARRVYKWTLIHFNQIFFQQIINLKKCKYFLIFDPKIMVALKSNQISAVFELPFLLIP